MQLTGNYELKKPEQNDAYNIQNENDNMDIIDRELNNISAANTNIYLTTNIGNNYSISVPNLTTLTDGYPITVKFNVASTGVITINPSGLGAKNVVDYFGNTVTNVRSNLIANLRYESTSGNFQLLGKGGGGNVTADKMLNGITATGDNGPVVGNIPSKASAIIIPGTTDQIISANQYLSGPQTIKGTPSLIPSNIIDTANVFGVQGTANIQSLGGLRMQSGQTPIGSYTQGSILTLNGQGTEIHQMYLDLSQCVSFTPKIVFGHHVIVSSTGIETIGAPFCAISNIANGGFRIAAEPYDYYDGGDGFTTDYTDGHYWLYLGTTSGNTKIYIKWTILG